MGPIQTYWIRICSFQMICIYTNHLIHYSWFPYQGGGGSRMEKRDRHTTNRQKLHRFISQLLIHAKKSPDHIANITFPRGSILSTSALSTPLYRPQVFLPWFQWSLCPVFKTVRFLVLKSNLLWWIPIAPSLLACYTLTTLNLDKCYDRESRVFEAICI